MDWRTMTNEDALAEWDRGEIVWSCDMGGMGPGYEQCIQIMGFEILRAMIANPVDDWDALTRDVPAWKEYRDKIEAVPNVLETVKQLGPSGAQYGAAMNLAFVFARHGYSKGMEKIPNDRRIMVSSHFPTLDGVIAARGKS